MGQGHALSWLCASAPQCLMTAEQRSTQTALCPPIQACCHRLLSGKSSGEIAGDMRSVGNKRVMPPVAKDDEILARRVRPKRRSVSPSVRMAQDWGCAIAPHAQRALWR